MNYRHAIRNDLHSILRLYAELHPDEEPLSPVKAELLWNTIGSSDYVIYFVEFLPGRSVVAGD